MNDLFSIPATYPNAPGYARGRETSRAAAETVWNPTDRQKTILAILKEHPMTDHELSAFTLLPMAVIQPRRSDLTALGKVVDSGERRITPYGKKAVVWKLA